MNQTRKYTIVALAAVGIVLCGLALVPAVKARSPMAEGDEDEVRVTITTRASALAIPLVVRTGDPFTVALRANHTTGYQWQLISKPSAQVLKSTGSVYGEPGGKVVGAGGTEVWSFRAYAHGKTSFTLGYLRSWEKGVKPIKTQQFTIAVQ